MAQKSTVLDLVSHYHLARQSVNVSIAPRQNVKPVVAVKDCSVRPALQAMRASWLERFQ